MKNNKNLYLVYVEAIGVNFNDEWEYEFLFSETPDVVWGEDWAEQCPSACENLRPDDSMVSEVRRLSTIIPFSTAQRNSCFSMQDCIDGILAIAWENISEYDEYPEPFRLVFEFGERIDSVVDKLSKRSQFFEGDEADSGPETEEEEEPETPPETPDEDIPF